MKTGLFIICILLSVSTKAQDCNKLVASDGHGEYAQTERTKGAAFRDRTVATEMWVTMSGGFLYLNMQFKDTVQNVTIRNSHKDAMAYFSFTGNRSVGFYLPNRPMGTTVSIPLNTKPSDGTQIRTRNNSTEEWEETTDFYKVLELFFKEQVVFAHYGSAASEKNVASFDKNSMVCTVNTVEAIKLQHSVMCILKENQ